MIDTIAEPVAWADVHWRSATDGGRESGPPTAPVYAANCTFPLGGESDLVPEWPATADKFSLLLQKLAENADGTWHCALDFLVRDLISERLHPGAPMLVMEGPKVVADAVVTAIDAGALNESN